MKDTTMSASETSTEAEGSIVTPDDDGDDGGASLEPHEISSRNFYFGPKKILKGYQLSDFKDAWDRCLPPISGKVTRRANHEPDTNLEPEPSGLKTSASDPQAPNSSEINASCGIAD